MNNKTQITIFIDGSCLENPGHAAGCGVSTTINKLIFNIGFNPDFRFINKDNFKSTNNQMEILAFIMSSEIMDSLVSLHSNLFFQIFSDSNYVVQSINNWLYGWAKKNWKKKPPIQNLHMWQYVYKMIQESLNEEKGNLYLNINNKKISFNLEHIPAHGKCLDPFKRKGNDISDLKANEISARIKETIKCTSSKYLQGECKTSITESKTEIKGDEYSVFDIKINGSNIKDFELTSVFEVLNKENELLLRTLVDLIKDKVSWF